MVKVRTVDNPSTSTAAEENITKRKRVEDELRKFKTISDEAGYGITIVDLEGNVSYVNTSFARMHGYTPDELIGKHLSIFHTEQQMANVNRLREQLNREGSFVAEELWHKRSDGTEFPTLMHGTLVKDENGNPLFMAGTAVEVTERKRAEEALERQRAYFQQLFDNSPEAIVLLDDTNRIVNTNNGFETLFGYTIEEVKGQPISEVIVPEDRIEEALTLGQGILNNEVCQKETVRKRKDGSLVDVSLLGYPIRLGNKAVGAYVIYRDISEHKQAEEALRESQKFSSSLLESSPNPTLVINPDTSVRYVNPAFEKLTGFTLAKITGRKAPYPWWPEGQRKEITAALKDAMAHGGRRSERNFQKKNGERLWVALNSAPVVHKGKLIYFLINWLDITKRKQAEELFRTLTNSSPVGIYIVQDGKFQLANPQFQKLTGYTEDELVGTDSLALVLAEDRDMVRKKAIKMLKGELSSPYQFRVVNKAGETRWVMETVTSIRYRGRQATLGNYMDITERKHMEEQLTLTDRLASIGELASGIAHELNNPLTSVIGFSQLLMEENISDNLKEDLGTIYSEAQRAASIVKNLLTFARKHAPMRQPSRVNTIIEDVLQLRAYEHKVNNIEVDKRFDANLPEIMVDYFQMQQVFLNVIVNAESAMLEANGRGKLVITTERINNVIKVTIADDGPGIPRENLRRVFDPFFTTKEVGKGTGLGLSICHGIVTEHGGRIYAQGEISKGATFAVELPVDGAEL